MYHMHGPSYMNYNLSFFFIFSDSGLKFEPNTFCCFLIL